ncbi:interleukin-22 receptor subunit alpha-1-like [Sinocyclocheilus rhinocerous]|uniref:interleukin-22 receptor subunit alpha-1-like n=1 Tax=Sinocyclocheilus rhinocerous TaxID=307959 RepID=UPI0007B83835|nr:PREDICTED: interleukin-22 receptor subunit alpha-1-like [Sinocyclocheilus rhinocerous]
MWPLRVTVFLLCFTGCWGQSCNRTKAYFESRNFFSVLHWDPVDVPGQTLLYSVQYNHYGKPYEPVTWCENISTPVCDMTDVMTHVMSDVTSKYHVKVSAGGRCLGEVMFTPFWETTFAAPQLSVTSNQTHLNVTVSPPMAAWNCSIENIGFWGKGFQRSSIKYTVRLTHPESLAGKVFEDTSRSVFLWLVETDVQYCGDVLYTLTHPGRSSPSENASFCVTVSAPKSWLHILIWPCLLALLLLIVLPIMLCQLSVKRKSSLPKPLILPKNSSPAFCSYPRDDISKVEVWSGFVATVDPQAVFPTPKSEIVVNDAYASQEPCDQEWTHDQPDIPVQDSPESSVHYSMIVPVQISIEPPSDGTTDETHSDSFGPESISSFSIRHSDTENNSGPLVVPVRPTKNGALQFHDCLFQCDTGQNSPEPSQDSEGLSGEQTPLLSDLVQKDSRCSSSYLPLHVSDVVTSNYRQNWLPGIPLEGQQDQRTYVMRTDHLQDSTEPDEDFIDEEEPRVGVIFLDRWMVETQGLTLSCN